jgi:hypothetical protein
MYIDVVYIVVYTVVSYCDTTVVFYVLLTVHRSIILVINQIDEQKSCFIKRLLYSSTCLEQAFAHHHVVKIVLYSI